MGRPVIAAEYMDTVGDQGDIMLADLSEYQMIEKGGVQAASSIHVNFLNDETVFRFVYRVDGQPKWNSPLTPKNSALTQSPFIVLDARA
jgi:HK97 family phage major capsid protein